MNTDKLVVDGINMMDHGILERGTFDHRGLPTGWTVQGRVNSKMEPSITVTLDQRILIGGIYSPTLTEESRKAGRWCPET